MKGIVKNCPKCGVKLSPFYMKQDCPQCGVNLLYYGIEEELERDAEQAEKEIQALWSFVRKVDKAHLVEKYFKKQNKALPWEEEVQESEE